MPAYCSLCHKEIPQERIECGFSLCIKCSDTKRIQGFMSFGHKTASEIVLVNPKDKESLRRATNTFKRKR